MKWQTEVGSCVCQMDVISHKASREYEPFFLSVPVYFLIPTAFSFLLGFEWWMDTRHFHAQPLGKLIFIEMTNFYLWAVIGIAVWYLVQRFPLRTGMWMRNGAIHVLLAGGASFLHLIRYSLVTWLHSVPGDFGLWVVDYYLRAQAITYAAAYFGLLFVFRGLVSERTARSAQVRAAALEAELTRAKLQTLKAQLHPHFLFNSLNCISGLMRRDPELADRMLERLSELLRSTLELNGKESILLSEELEFAEQYLTLQQMRYGKRMRFAIEASEEALQCAVPALLLQPLVENAVVHGIAPRVDASEIRIHCATKGEQLTMDLTNHCQDDAPGVGAAGLGLKITRDRLN